MAWIKNGTPNTLTTTGDVMTISDLTAKIFNLLLCHTLNSGLIETFLRFDNDSGTNYARRVSVDGGTDTTDVSASQIENSPAESNAINQNATGAATAPDRSETVGKDAGTTQFTRVDIVNTRAGDYAIDSNLSMLGTSSGEVLITIQDGAVYEETDTNKHFLWDATIQKWTEIND